MANPLKRWQQLVNGSQTKTANLYQNEDLVDALGYQKTEEMTPQPKQNEPDQKSSVMSMFGRILDERRKKKATPPPVGIAGVRD